MRENRFSKGVADAKKRTVELEAKKVAETKPAEDKATSEPNLAKKTVTNDAELSLDDIIGKRKKTTSSSHTFYLEDDVFKKVAKAAKTREMTLSAFVNEVFKQMKM